MDSVCHNLVYCHKYKKKTVSIDSQNGVYWIAIKSSVCKTNKTKFVKKPEGKTKSDTKKKLSKEDYIWS